MKKKGNLSKIFFYLSLVILGIVAGTAFGHYGTLPLSQEINLIDLATLVVTIFLAVYVPAVLDRNLQVVKDRKNLLEDRISDYQTLLRRVNMSVQGEHTMSLNTYLTIKNLLDIAGNRLHTLTSLIRNSDLDESLNRDVSKIKELDEEHRTLLLNQTNEKNEVEYSDQVRRDEELLYNQIDEATSLLIFKISSVK